MCNVHTISFVMRHIMVISHYILHAILWYSGRRTCTEVLMSNWVDMFSMCSLVVSILDSPAVDPRSNPGSGTALLMSEKSQAVYYISSCHMLIDKALSSDKPNGHWFEADWLHCKRDALSRNRKVDGSRLTGSTQACHS